MSESASKRILMVEDEEDIAFLIRYMLERHGFVVDHAADPGAGALVGRPAPWSRRTPGWRRR